MDPAWCILIVTIMGHLHCTHSLPMVQVKEPSGSVLLRETVNVDRIKHHMQLWVTELGSSTDKLDKLMAVSIMRESTMLLDSIFKTAGLDMKDMLAKERSNQKEENGVRRVKRNVLGDLIHSLTGLATEDQLQQQSRIDTEIRDRVKDTLTRQVTFEKTISTLYSNLSREEEMIQQRLDMLQTQRSKDKSQQTRARTLAHIALEDIQDLEDVLEAIWTGQVNARHSVKLSHSAGLSEAAHFTFDRVEMSKDGLVVQYCTTLYTRVTASMVESTNTHLIIQTPGNNYILHGGYNLEVPLSPRETIYNMVPCSTCCILTYIHANSYRVIQAGNLTCKGSGQIHCPPKLEVVIIQNDTCWNQATKIDGARLKTKEFTIDIGGRDRSEAILLQKSLASTPQIYETAKTVKAAHNLAMLKFQHDVNGAQQDLDNFLADTKIDMNIQFVKDTVVWSTLGGVALVVLMIVGCICIRYRKNKNRDIVVMSPAPPVPS